MRQTGDRGAECSSSSLLFPIQKASRPGSILLGGEVPGETARGRWAGSGAAAGPVPPQVVHASESAAQIAETGRLFLRNLSYAATEGDLTALLEKHGELKEVHLCVDRCTPPAPPSIRPRPASHALRPTCDTPARRRQT